MSMSRRIVAYLECGCAVYSDGHRAWCPSCSSPFVRRAEAAEQYRKALLVAERYLRVEVMDDLSIGSPPTVTVAEYARDFATIKAAIERARWEETR